MFSVSVFLVEEQREDFAASRRCDCVDAGLLDRSPVFLHARPYIVAGTQKGKGVLFR